MNRNGYTLIELLVTIVVIGLILLFIYPAIKEMIDNNNTETYTQYKNMMIEYAKVNNTKATASNPNVYIVLMELDGLEQIKKDCNGYVHLQYVENKPNNYTAYISCTNSEPTEGYNELIVFQQYERIIVDNAKVSNTKATVSNPNVYLNLSNVEGLEQIKKDCRGYVHLHYVEDNPNEYKSYISCNNGYKTTGYSASYE